MDELKGINIKCGKLSYTEIAKEYQYIYGITGTYKCLHEKSKEFLSNYFDEFCIIPSIFQTSKTKMYFEI